MWLFVPVLLLAVLHYAIAVRTYGILTPDGLFVVFNLLMVFGTLKLVDPGSSTEAFYGLLVVGAVATYLVVSLVTFLCLSASRRTTPRRMGSHAPYAVRLVRPTAAVLLVTVGSMLVTAMYFAAVGYSAFVVGLKGLLNGEPEDVRTLRLESYAGENYVFPGYANQFRNILLPSLAVILAIWFFNRPGRLGRILALLPLSLAVLGLVGTGQRGAFFLFLLTLVVYSFLAVGRALSRWVLLVPVLGTPVVLLATQVLGRSAGAENPLAATGSELYRRFLEDNQLTGVAAFNYTSQLPVSNGGEWLRSLLGVLPGDRGSTLANEVFATLYGSPVGTAPPSLWGSVHHNVGTVGVFVAAAVLAFILQAMSFHGLRRRSYNSLELIGYAGMTVVLGTWVAGGPETLLNTGLVAYLALWYWGGRIKQTNTVPVRVRRPSSRQVGPPPSPHRTVGKHRPPSATAMGRGVPVTAGR
ncbi:O-antigen polymerase [Micromonospora thermarum]|uniref:Oligosaccharide repeat unit polymerase n=1 Tax=Micromonospora thermarum TaxID=2720024 RepID=A0ABX0Z869_9ACTN|nr:O-antigen polymerase [Micromonospora thermarum]NJP32599.1 oligosaccharide repeat unit polymerase [Micromonospora thermarum]